MAFTFPTGSGGNEKDPSDSINGHDKTPCVWMQIFLAAALYFVQLLCSLGACLAALFRLWKGVTFLPTVQWCLSQFLIKRLFEMRVG